MAESVLKFGLVTYGILAVLLVTSLVALVQDIPKIAVLIFGLTAIMFAIDSAAKWAFSFKPLAVTTAELLAGLVLVAYSLNLGSNSIYLLLVAVALVLTIWFIRNTRERKEIYMKAMGTMSATLLILYVSTSVLNMSIPQIIKSVLIPVIGVALLLAALSTRTIESILKQAYDMATKGD